VFLLISFSELVGSNFLEKKVCLEPTYVGCYFLTGCWTTTDCLVSRELFDQANNGALSAVYASIAKRFPTLYDERR